MYCPQCGKSIPDDSKFCHVCGAKTILESPAGQPITPPLADSHISDKNPPTTQGEVVIAPETGGNVPPPPSAHKFPPYPFVSIIIWAATVLIGTGAVAWWTIGWNILSPLLWVTAGLLILSALVDGIPRRILGFLALLCSLGILYRVVISAIAQKTTYWGNISFYGWEVDTPFLVVSVAGIIVLLVLSCTRLFGKRGSLFRKYSSDAEGSSPRTPGKLQAKILVTSVIAIVLAGIIMGYPLYSLFTLSEKSGVGGDLPGVNGNFPQETYPATMVPTLSPGNNPSGSIPAIPTRPPINTMTQSTSPPSALFSQSASSGNAPLTVNFKDESTGFPTTWSWDFGDGNSASIQNPVHTYATAGTYSVRLSVTGPGGRSTSYPQQTTVYSTTPTSVVASFSATPSTGVVPLAVTFTDQSSGSPATWNWDFGDGGTSTLRSPAHTYMTPGQYTARLTVRSGSGLSSIAITPIMVSAAVTTAVTTTVPTPVHTIDDISGKISPIKASFTYTPDLGPLPLLVRFQDTSTGSPTAWLWDFGDGSTSSLKNPVHTYTKPGDFHIRLSVTSATGSSQADLGPVSAFYQL